MSRVVIFYGTTEGQTAKIAQHIADVGRNAGHQVDVQHAAELDPDFSLAPYDAAILGASVHEGRHQQYMVDLARGQARWLSDHPSAFFSVCLSIASDDPEERAEAQAIADHFTESVGWAPPHRTVVAGALRYSEYSWLKRMLMKRIAAKESGDTDTSRDYEYTDWEAVTAWAKHFYATLGEDRSRKQLVGRG
ncbi:MAG: flavodoxin domain-containing protein [Myxococcales bacterium]|nr:flavodoxin domain-containing protein [Myxococcales bacterium]